MIPAYPRFGSTELAQHRFELPVRPGDLPLDRKSPSTNTDERSIDQSTQTAFQGLDTSRRKRVGFLDLPPEVRTKIYHELGFCTNHSRSLPTSKYPDDDVRVRASYIFKDASGRHDRRRTETPLRPLVRATAPSSTGSGGGVSTQVMRLCKRVADETYELLYEGTGFGITWDIANSQQTPQKKGQSTTADENNKTKGAVAVAVAVAATADAAADAAANHEDDDNDDEDKKKLRLAPSLFSHRSLSFLTHVIVGPFDGKKDADSASLEVHTRTIEYLTLRCRNLAYLGIFLNSKTEISSSGPGSLRALVKALETTCRQRPLQKVWLGSHGSPYVNLDMKIFEVLKKRSNGSSRREERMSLFDSSFLKELKRKSSEAQKHAQKAAPSCLSKHVGYQQHRRVLSKWYTVAGKAGRQYAKAMERLENALDDSTPPAQGSPHFDKTDSWRGLRSDGILRFKPWAVIGSNEVVEKADESPSATQLHVLFCSRLGREEFLAAELDLTHVSCAIWIMEHIDHANSIQRAQVLTFLKKCFTKSRYHNHRRLLTLVKKMRKWWHSLALVPMQETLESQAQWLKKDMSDEDWTDLGRNCWLTTYDWNRKCGAFFITPRTTTEEARQAIVDQISRAFKRMNVGKEPPAGKSSGGKAKGSKPKPSDAADMSR